MTSNREITAGSLLVSEPLCNDSYFKRSVVLIVEHTQDSDVGFILNKCLTLDLCDLVESFPKNTDYTLCLGGPVSPSTLHYIHTLGNILIPGSVHIKENLYWGGDFDIITQLIQSGEISEDDIKFFLGYSGWSNGQLSEEIEQGDWEIYEKFNSEDIVCCNDNFWYEVVQNSDKFMGWSLIPQNPQDN